MISWLRQLGGWTPRGRFRLKLNFTTAIVAGLVLRLLVAAYNGFIGPSFGANSDALAFHFMAEDYARNLGAIEFQVGWIYSCFLAFVYALTFDSLFIGCVMSCLTWLTSAWVLARLLRLLAIPRAERFTIGLLYAFLPSSILYTGVTLREPYQLLFVNLAIYSALMIAMKKAHGYWIGLVLATVGMGLLHGGLMAVGLFIAVGTIVMLALRGTKGISVPRLAVLVPLAALVGFYGLSVLASSAYNLDKGLDVAVAAYQQGALGSEARANYSMGPHLGSMQDLILFVPVSLLQYLFEPMPWRGLATTDLVALLENALRAVLIARAIMGLRAMPAQGRRPVLFVFLTYIMTETIWSLGTVNWGTAVRHHLPSFGLLIVAAHAGARQPSIRRAAARRAAIHPAVT